LLQAISVRARDEGVRTFTALMLAGNHEMMDLFEHLGPVRIVERAGGTVEIDGRHSTRRGSPRPAPDGRHADSPCLRRVSEPPASGPWRPRLAATSKRRETVDCNRERH
jgi:hypothetical protein